MVTGGHLFTFSVIADTHITEAEAMAVSGFDIDTVKLGAGRHAMMRRRIGLPAPSWC